MSYVVNVSAVPPARHVVGSNRQRSTARDDDEQDEEDDSCLSLVFCQQCNDEDAKCDDNEEMRTGNGEQALGRAAGRRATLLAPRQTQIEIESIFLVWRHATRTRLPWQTLMIPLGQATALSMGLLIGDLDSDGNNCRGSVRNGGRLVLGPGVRSECGQSAAPKRAASLASDDAGESEPC